MPYSNLALDADRENGPAARSFPTGQARGLKAHADAHDCIMVRIKPSYRIQVCGTKMRPQWRAPLGSLNRPTDRHRSDTEAMPKARLAVHRRCACSGVKSLRNTSDARRQAAKLCYRFGPLTPSARSANLIAGDGTKNGFPAPNKEPPINQNNSLDRKSPIQVRIRFAPAGSLLRTLIEPGRSVRRRFSSQSSAPPISPMPRRAGPRRWPTGSGDNAAVRPI